MPYIKEEDREKIYIEPSSGVEAISLKPISTPGEIQYAIAKLVQTYIARNGLNYQNCNDVMGALAGAQMEFYRRIVAPYEDSKIETNGDI